MWLDAIPEGLKLWLATFVAAGFDWLLGMILGLLGVAAA